MTTDPRPGLVAWTGLPRWAAFVWLVLAIPAALGSAEFLWERTYLFWSRGPGMTGYWMAHSTEGRVMLLAGLLLAIWFAIAIGGVLLHLLRRRAVPGGLLALLTLTLIVIAPLIVPSRMFERATLRLFGPGNFAPDIMVDAAAHCDRSMIGVLLKQGVDINGFGLNKRLPIVAAAVDGDPDCIRWLVAEGANVNAVEGGGMTALLGAAEMNSSEVVRLLLSLGANPRVVRFDGKTPLEIARERGNAEIVKALGGGAPRQP